MACEHVLGSLIKRIKLISKIMAKVTFTEVINEVRGALDSVKDGQANRARLVCKWQMKLCG